MLWKKRAQQEHSSIEKNPDMISMPRASNIVIFEIYKLHDVGAAGMLLESHAKFTNWNLKSSRLSVI